MKIIFLDMDGVLCTYRASQAVRETGMMTYLDPIAVKLVERLVVDNSAKIVISSTWRRFKNRKEMEEVFKCAGSSIIADAFHETWCTPENSSRGFEINTWLTMATEQRGESIEKYVILDDHDDFMAEQQEFFVQCDQYDGIGFRQYIRAQSLLEGKIIGGSRYELVNRSN